MKLSSYLSPFVVLVVVLAFSSCRKTTYQQEIDNEKVLLSKYINKFHKGVSPTSSGLYYIQTKAGNGRTIADGNYVKVFYKGYLIEDNDSLGIKDGAMFDSSGDFEPFGFTVGAGSVITGWEEAIKLMTDGGEAKWIIPSKIAYAGTIQGTIPAYSTLVFYVKIFKVYRSTDTLNVIQKQPILPVNLK
ncbi:MAG: FKBP-type peptidyl-prolyl cis-trans isomerase [Marinilabiliales bacterium]|nr:FKBP-type peptidyl-prolyl cis-trans isomerase [Marinilabiliales bacterium]